MRERCVRHRPWFGLTVNSTHTHKLDLLLPTVSEPIEPVRGWMARPISVRARCPFNVSFPLLARVRVSLLHLRSWASATFFSVGRGGRTFLRFFYSSQIQKNSTKNQYKSCNLDTAQLGLWKRIMVFQFSEVRWKRISITPYFASHSHWRRDLTFSFT